VLVLQIFPIPSGWELIAPMLGLVVLACGAVFGRLRGHRAREAFAPVGDREASSTLT